MEGVILGFDEYMNVVLDDAEEVIRGLISVIGDMAIWDR